MITKNTFLTVILLLILITISFFIFIKVTSVNDIEKLILKEIKKELATSTQEKSTPKQPEKDKISTTTEEENFDIRATTTEKIILINIPFTSQAPFGKWSDPRQQDGCEETAALMAMRWVRGAKLSKEEAEKEILAIAQYEQDNYNSYIDTSVADTVERIFKGYFKYNFVNFEYDITIDKIISELLNNNIVIVPANGQKLKNPYYTPPGPERHNILIRGYDFDTKEFITNDAGTRHGEGYRYKEDVLYNAIRDYPTGDHLPIMADRKAMIAVKKN